MSKETRPYDTDTQFAQEVAEGLTATPKYLSSKYFYDQRGDLLFQKIMAMPAYYLTDCEYAILDRYKQRMGILFQKGSLHFNLIELGAGDGKKTKLLLKEFAAQHYDFTYRPIDISQNALDGLARSLAQELPDIDVAGIQGTYLEALGSITKSDDTKNIILFLGSNIGNLPHDKALDFLKQIKNAMAPADLLLVGFDQKKHPQVILDAYNDETKITAAFNKNILIRINEELGADFKVDQFLHWETYDPQSGTAKSYLVAKAAQTVTVAALDLSIDFKAWESIHTERSQKYDDTTVSWLAEQAGLGIVEQYSDDRGYYKNYIFEQV